MLIVHRKQLNHRRIVIVESIDVWIEMGKINRREVGSIMIDVDVVEFRRERYALSVQLKSGDRCRVENLWKGGCQFWDRERKLLIRNRRLNVSVKWVCLKQ